MFKQWYLATIYFWMLKKHCNNKISLNVKKQSGQKTNATRKTDEISPDIIC